MPKCAQGRRHCCRGVDYHGRRRVRSCGQGHHGDRRSRPLHAGRMTYLTLQENWLTKGFATTLATVPEISMKLLLASLLECSPACHERLRLRSHVSVLGNRAVDLSRRRAEWTLLCVLPLVLLSPARARHLARKPCTTQLVRVSVYKSSTGDATLAPDSRLFSRDSPRTTGWGWGASYQARADERSECSLSRTQPHLSRKLRVADRPVDPSTQRSDQPSHQRAS